MEDAKPAALTVDNNLRFIDMINPYLLRLKPLRSRTLGHVIFKRDYSPLQGLFFGLGQ
jgi:hypothetical protein